MGFFFYYLTYQDKILNLHFYIFEKYFTIKKLEMDFRFSPNRRFITCAMR